jgi:hypothetical protein
MYVATEQKLSNTDLVYGGLSMAVASLQKRERDFVCHIAGKARHGMVRPSTRHLQGSWTWTTILVFGGHALK